MVYVQEMCCENFHSRDEASKQAKRAWHSPWESQQLLHEGPLTHEQQLQQKHSEIDGSCKTPFLETNGPRRPSHPLHASLVNLERAAVRAVPADDVKLLDLLGLDELADLVNVEPTAGGAEDGPALVVDVLDALGGEVERRGLSKHRRGNSSVRKWCRYHAKRYSLHQTRSKRTAGS